MPKKKKKSVTPPAHPGQNVDVERKMRTVIKNITKAGVAPKVKAAMALTGLSSAGMGAYAMQKDKLKENDAFQTARQMIDENEMYLGALMGDYREYAKEWQGPNIPYGSNSDRPNLIRQCTMLEDVQLKINCLRKLRDQVAMNPFYQYRIDRYIDEITDTYEPTEKPGTIPGNEFKASGVGEDKPLFEQVRHNLTNESLGQMDEPPKDWPAAKKKQFYRDKSAAAKKHMKRAVATRNVGWQKMLKKRFAKYKSGMSSVSESNEDNNKPLNKPFRLPSGSAKKFGVRVKNDKGNIVTVKFGDPSLEIKRDDPKRLKSFRARHGCDNPGPKWKAKYWSCKFWEKRISVTQLLGGK